MTAGCAGIIRGLGPSDRESLPLAVSPGGFAELTLTATALNLGIAPVTGFHLLRAITVNGLALPVWSRSERLAGFAPRDGRP